MLKGGQVTQAQKGHATHVDRIMLPCPVKVSTAKVYFPRFPIQKLNFHITFAHMIAVLFFKNMPSVIILCH